MSDPIRVLVVDDDPMVRVGLAMIIATEPRLLLAGEAADGDEVPAAVVATSPGVVLMDVRMPRVDGLTATELLRAGSRPPEVIMLTTFHADGYVLRALRAGASGFLLKDTAPADILHAVCRVAAGEPMLSPQVTRQLIAHVGGDGTSVRARRQRAVAALARLSDRERHVADAIARGASNVEIGAELFVSVATVKTHVSSILTKLDLNNRTQIALLAHDAGLTL